MTDEQLKKLEDQLWDTANSLRAYGGIKASDYATPILGLIFLKFADNKYSEMETQIQEEFNNQKGARFLKTQREISLEKSTSTFWASSLFRKGKKEESSILLPL